MISTPQKIKPVVLLAQQRSGTTALGSVLDQSDHIKCFGEVFYCFPNNYFDFLAKLAEEDKTFLYPDGMRTKFDKYIDYLASFANNKPFALLDIKYNSTHHLNGFWFNLSQRPVLFDILIERKIPIIHLLRRNFLKRYVSASLARKSKVWHAHSAEQVINSKSQTIKLDPAKLIENLQFQSSELALALKYLGEYENVLTLIYEKLFDMDGNITSSTEEGLCEFLGLDRLGSRTPRLKKMTQNNLRNVIENFDEVALALASTPYEWMLTQDSPDTKRGIQVDKPVPFLSKLKTWQSK